MLKLSYQMPCGCCTREISLTSHFDSSVGYVRGVASGLSQLFAIVEQETNLLMAAPQSVSRN